MFRSMTKAAESKSTAPADGAARAGSATGQPLRAALRGFLWSPQDEVNGPAIVTGLIVLVVVFTLGDHRFIYAANLFNLFQQIAPTGIVAVGICLTLMIGEIDLSVAALSGFCGAVGGFLISPSLGGLLWGPHWMHSRGTLFAVVVALVIGVLAGLIQGALVTIFRLPGFVVTLGGLLVWTGLQILVVGQANTIGLPSGSVLARYGTATLPGWAGWLVLVVIVGCLALVRAASWRKRAAAGLEQPRPMAVSVLRLAALAVVGVISVIILNHVEGVPVLGLTFVLIVVIANLVVKHTSWGRHVLAIGRDAEAARRSDIRVGAAKLAVFAVCSGLAAVGGLALAASLQSVSSTLSNDELLLDAIAAAVIGGTSLFGGRGTTFSALAGMLVIGSVENGLDLLSVGPATRYVVEGVILALAVVADSLAKRRVTA
jgi:D-xylose transport system permease protein